MKQGLAMLLCLLLVFSIAGCDSRNHGEESDILFYYLRSEQSYYGQDGGIQAVTPDNLTRASDLYYLLAFYLSGPTDSIYRSPFPMATKVISVKEETEGALTVITSPHLNKLTGLEQTNACACLALTCMNLTGATKVSILCLDKEELIPIMELSLDSILLEDRTPIPTDGGTQ